MLRDSRLCWAAGAALLVAACSVYGTDLLDKSGSGAGPASSSSSGGAGGAGGFSSGSSSTGSSSASSTSSSSSSSSGGGAGGASSSSSSASSASSTSSASSASSSASSSTSTSSGAMPCQNTSQCQAMMTECQKPACMGGFCGIVYTPQGTAIAAQKAGDCQSVVCDGQGNTASVAADADLPSDLNDCTTDTCTAGVPSFAQNPKGSPCNQLGGTLCTASAKCVQCLSASDCASGVCNAMNACVAAQCNDAVKNGAETDIDCGGGTCPACGYAKSCGAGTDCVSMQCASGKCAATCSDGAEDGLETDVDCGGPCAKCATGKKCGGGADCMSGHCTAGLCADVLVIGQVQSRGDNGGSDEFVEIYNPTSIPVIFDATWTLRARNATGGLAMCASNSLATRFTGSGQSIPPHGHILFVNTTVPSYNGATPGDGTYSTGIPDAASLVLQHGNTVIDALCFYFDATTQGTLTGCSGPYICEGTPITNPHNNTSGTNADASLERKPGGAAGNTVDTNDNATDFATNAAADPHDLASAPTP